MNGSELRFKKNDCLQGAEINYTAKECNCGYDEEYKIISVLLLFFALQKFFFVFLCLYGLS